MQMSCGRERGGKTKRGKSTGAASGQAELHTDGVQALWALRTTQKCFFLYTERNGKLLKNCKPRSDKTQAILWKCSFPPIRNLSKSHQCLPTPLSQILCLIAKASVQHPVRACVWVGGEVKGFLDKCKFEGASRTLHPGECR